MKKRKHLHTNFIKFIVEKYKKEIEELPDEETNVSNKDLVDEFDEIMNDKENQKLKKKIFKMNRRKIMRILTLYLKSI